MIVLDEQLPYRTLIPAIRRWYRGRVCLITELRPATVVKDDAILSLLLTARQPTFVTLNWTDFWPRTSAHPRLCLLCFALETDRALEIAVLLRRLFRLPDFKTRATRMGKIARVSSEQVAYYQVRSRQVHRQPLP